MSNEIHELGAVNSLGGVNKKMTGSESGSKQKEYTGKMLSVEVLQPIEIFDENNVSQGTFLEVGSEQNVPEELAKSWIKNKLAKKLNK